MQLTNKLIEQNIISLESFVSHFTLVYNTQHPNPLKFYQFWILHFTIKCFLEIRKHIYGNDVVCKKCEQKRGDKSLEYCEKKIIKRF